MMTTTDIKTELRTMMNGVASAAMREAGMTADYRVNFGVELPRLTALAADIAAQTPSDALAPLAQQLWNERVRECRILGTMLYPAVQFDGELADIWVDDIRTAELAQIAALNLFSQMTSASVKAFEWIASDSDMRQIAGYYTLAHLLRTCVLNERSANELRDQAQAAQGSANAALRMAALRAVSRLDASLA